MLDHLEDIESDLSVFHRIDDPMQLDSPRYFRLAERLHHYGGAVTAARGTHPATAVVVPTYAPAPAPAPPAAAAELSGELLAAMSDNPGFPGIEYVGRG